MILENKTLKKNASELTANEEMQLRGTIASINWIAREARPDASAAASILAGCFPNPTAENALEARVVNKIKGHNVVLRIFSILEDKIHHILIADSSYDPSGKQKPQHGWLQGITDDTLNRGASAPISLMSWAPSEIAESRIKACCAKQFPWPPRWAPWRSTESLRWSRYSPRKYAECDDDSGLHGAPTVIASENPRFADQPGGNHRRQVGVRCHTLRAGAGRGRPQCSRDRSDQGEPGSGGCPTTSTRRTC